MDSLRWLAGSERVFSSLALAEKTQLKVDLLLQTGSVTLILASPTNEQSACLDSLHWRLALTAIASKILVHIAPVKASLIFSRKSILQLLDMLLQTGIVMLICASPASGRCAVIRRRILCV